MIQRIQSLFILLSIGLMVAMYFIPLAGFSDKGMEISWKLTGLLDSEGNVLLSTIPLIALVFVVAALLLVTLLAFKNRRIQLRLCIYNIIVLIGVVGLMIYYFFKIKNGLELEYRSFSYSAIFPIITIILILLAFRSIRKDEELVKSVDRIR